MASEAAHFVREPMKVARGANRRSATPFSSLDGDRRASSLEGIAGLAGGFLVDLLQDSLRSRFDQILGLFQAEAGEAADLLDDLNLLVARRLEDDVDLVALFFLWGSAVAASSGRSRGRCHGNRCRRRHAEGGLELLDELAELDQSQLLERVQELCGAELRHDGGSLLTCRPRRVPRRWSVLRQRRVPRR